MLQGRRPLYRLQSTEAVEVQAHFLTVQKLVLTSSSNIAFNIWQLLICTSRPKVLFSDRLYNKLAYTYCLNKYTFSKYIQSLNTALIIDIFDSAETMTKCPHLLQQKKKGMPSH